MSTQARDARICACGYSVGDPWVVPKQRYSLFGWFVMSCGIMTGLRMLFISGGLALMGT